MSLSGPSAEPRRDPETRAVSAERPTIAAEAGAAAPPASAAPAIRLRACVIVLAGRPFAVDVRSLREVMIVDRLLRVPGAPSFVRGVANLRGEVIAVVDVAPSLGFPARTVAQGDKALVLEPASLQVAIAVDEVLGLETFDEFRSREDSNAAGSSPSGAGWVARDGQLADVLDVREVVEALRSRIREGARSSWHGVLEAREEAG